MTHALRRALSATRLLVACGSLGDRDLGDDEGSLSGLHSRDRRKRRTHLRLEARARRGAGLLTELDGANETRKRTRKRRERTIAQRTWAFTGLWRLRPKRHLRR